MKIAFIKIFALTLLGFSLVLGSCDTDDYVINANGIQSDSTTIHLPYNGGTNTLTVSSMKPWSVEYDKAGRGAWLTNINVDNPEYTSRVTLSGETNPRRRRSTMVYFSNGFERDSVMVIQLAHREYEPGTVIYYENFGADTLPRGEEIAISSFTSWGARGSGVSVVRYSGTGAYIQRDVDAKDYDNQPHEEPSQGNNLKLEPGGLIKLPGLNKGEIDSVFLTLYAAARSGSSYLPLQANSIEIEGSTDDNEYSPIPLIISGGAGWQKIESEFRILKASPNFYLTIANSGTETLYIDDILLETGGRGTQVVGTPTPAITTLNATSITTTGAQLSGRYTLPADISSVVRAGIQWRHTSEPDFAEEDVPDTQPGTEFTYILTDLLPGEIYYYRAFTVHGDEIYTYGNELSFTTAEEPEGDSR